METYFARHTSVMAISGATRDRLWSERRIGVHYPLFGREYRAADNDSVDPSTYAGSGKKSMNAMQRLARDGGYVGAEYFGHHEMLVGFVAPQSQIEILKGEYINEQRVAAIKTLQLTKVVVVQPAERLVLAASRPRMASISRWTGVKSSVEDIVEGRPRATSWTSLISSRQEVACSEFLRLPGAAQLGLPRLESLLLPVGRTLQNLDFLGIATDGRRIAAQVTNYSLAASGTKFKRLLEYVTPGAAHVILFCDCEHLVVRDGIHIVPVQLVMATLQSHEIGRRFLAGP